MEHQNWDTIIFSQPDTQKRSENEKRISQQTYTEDVKIEAPKSFRAVNLCGAYYEK